MPSDFYELPFPPFFGVSFYDNTKILTEDGYRLVKMDLSSFDWRWYRHERYGIVQSCKLKFPVRILVNGVGVIEASESSWIFHDFKRIWVEQIDGLLGMVEIEEGIR